MSICIYQNNHCDI